MSGDDRSFFERVYALVRTVPRGRVVTYGQVAGMLGVVRGARAVGWALRALPAARAALVPWHRVVGAGGRISPRGGPGPEIQRRRLRAEGVVFRQAHVDLARHGLLAPESQPAHPRGLAPESQPAHPRGLAPERRNTRARRRQPG